MKNYHYNCTMTTTNKILERVDWKVLNDYIDNSLIIANKHPEYEIWILNYSPKTQAKKFWDIYTSSCRGLVIDVEGNILGRCMQKFKNLEEYLPSEIDMSKPFEIFEKVDGSLIEIFWYEPYMEWIIVSRGSFISEQALEAKKMIDSKFGALDALDKKCTYQLEIVYPTNRIVVNYGSMRDLILLTRINTETGKELCYDDLLIYYSKYFTVVKKYDIRNIKDLNELKKLEEDNKEGFVIRFEDGFRVKVKFAEYIRLHKIVTNVSNLTIWEHLMNKYDFDVLLNRVPDEFFSWLNKTVNILQQEFNNIERKALKEFLRISHINGIIERKEFAAEAIKSSYCAILFKMHDKKPYDELIWKMIRPKFSKPFQNGYEITDSD